jgi:CheY-like chemotaxis protein
MKFQHKDILLIDDDPVSNLINKRIIENQFGCNTIIFTNAEEALNQLKTWLTDQNDLLPPVIFLDIDMPHMTGWEFLDELHKLPQRAAELALACAEATIERLRHPWCGPDFWLAGAL